MNHLLTNRVLYAILAFLSFSCVLLVVKPSFIFHENGDLKQFGFGKNETLLSFGILSVVIPVISFYVFSSYDALKKHV